MQIQNLTCLIYRNILFQWISVVEMLLGYLRRPEAVAAVASLALLVAAPPPLPTFVPQGTPLPTAASAGTGGGNARATGGGILPGFALAVRIREKIS